MTKVKLTAPIISQTPITNDARAAERTGVLTAWRWSCAELRW